jgi:hypothetical protein
MKLPNIKILIRSRRGYKTTNEHRITEIELNHEDYIINGRRIKKSLLDSHIESYDGYHIEKCSLAFMSMNIPKPRGPLFIFGEYFMKKYYTVFDHDERIIGIAKANQGDDIIYEHIETPYNEVHHNDSNKLEVQSQEVLFKSEHKTINKDDFLVINP